MSGVAEKRHIVGLDIGTNKIAAVVGEISAKNELEIIGIGTHLSQGLKKGVVLQQNCQPSRERSPSPYMSGAGLGPSPWGSKGTPRAPQ